MNIIKQVASQVAEDFEQRFDTFVNELNKRLDGTDEKITMFQDDLSEKLRYMRDHIEGHLVNLDKKITEIQSDLATQGNRLSRLERRVRGVESAGIHQDTIDAVQQLRDQGNNFKPEIRYRVPSGYELAETEDDYILEPPYEG
jgi:hypothetical protein